MSVIDRAWTCINRWKRRGYDGQSAIFEEIMRMIPQWQPIDTAPKDKTRILAYGKHGFDVDEQKWATVVWDDHYDGFICDPNEGTEYDPEVSNVTHWMPLPEPPK